MQLPLYSSEVQRLQASASGDPSSLQIPLGPVIKCVVIASMGAFCFGYHLGVVNGPLGAIAADLGFADNAGLQGAVSLWTSFRLMLRLAAATTGTCCSVPSHHLLSRQCWGGMLL